MSVDIMAGQHPPPHQLAGDQIPNDEQPVSPPGSGDEPSDDNGERRRCGRRGGKRHHHHRDGRSPRGPDAEGFRGGPHGHRGFKRGPGGPGGPGPNHPLFDGGFPHFGPRGGHGFGPRGGPGGMFGFGPRGGPHGHHHHGGFRGQHHRGGRGWHGPLGFDFLQRFASEMGNGFEDFFTTDRRDVNGNQIDFIPRADVFNTAAEYVIHVSLPGAQKSDVSVDYDAQESTLRLSGVIHRPEFSEELHGAMVVDERRREVGVFERNINLATYDSQSVNVDEEKLSAKLVDGVLIVRLPKIDGQEKSGQNKKVVINEDTDMPLEKEMDEMNINSETEAGDLLQEEKAVYTPSHVSEEDAEEAADYVKVDVK